MEKKKLYDEFLLFIICINISGKLLFLGVFMKRLILGLVIFVLIGGFFWQQNNFEIAVNVTGIIGVGGILIGGFLKTGFINSSVPVLGNLAIIKLDEEIDLSNTVLLVALPNLIGSLLLYFLN
ncbi:hypothetical protein [Planococcus shixiaomingii]|nr:hypothetical protein [Planococcus sp. N028]